MLHGGWRGLAGGILAEGVRALREVGGAGPVTAALGPAARGCCYEVGEEVHAAFAAYDARRGERGLALEAVARAQLEAAGVAAVHDTGLCTMCADPALFFSHRRDGGVTGRQAGVAWRADAGLNAARVRANADRVRAEIAAAARRAGRDPDDVQLLAAVKYVAARGSRRARRGRRQAARREPRPGARGQGARPTGDRFRWHFIGQLQSRKVKQVLPLVELSTPSPPTRRSRQLERHGTPDTRVLVQVNVAGEEGKAGDRPRRAGRASSPAAPSRSPA